jgi:hypothetical protein
MVLPMICLFISFRSTGKLSRLDENFMALMYKSKIILDNL